MDFGLVGTIARLTNTRPNWDREVTRAVGAARACAIAALIGALGAEVEYADLRGIELRHQGTHVVGVYAGPVDTDMAEPFDLEKIPPADVATSALDALETDEPEAFAEDYSRAVKAGLSKDQATLYPEIERQFLEMTGAEATAT